MLFAIGIVGIGLLWAASIWLWITGMFPWLCMALYLAHLTIYFSTGRKLGERCGDPILKTVVLCMLLGYVYILWRRKKAVAEQLAAGAGEFRFAPAQDAPKTQEPGETATPKETGQTAEDQPLAAEPEQDCTITEKEEVKNHGD